MSGVREVDHHYQAIRDAEQALEKIRKNCKHEVTRIGSYMWRAGSTYLAAICTECDHPVREATEQEHRDDERRTFKLIAALSKSGTTNESTDTGTVRPTHPTDQ